MADVRWPRRSVAQLILALCIPGSALGRLCKRSEFESLSDVSIGFITTVNAHLIQLDECDNVFYRLVRCLNDSPCSASPSHWSGRATGSREEQLQYIGKLGNRATAFLAGKDALEDAVRTGGPYAYMNFLGIAPEHQDNATFGLAVVFATDDAKPVFPATWDVFHNATMFAEAFGAGSSREALGFEAAFGDEWLAIWTMTLDTLNLNCGLFAAVCPCPDDATWCTNEPCSVTASHDVPATFNPLQIFTEKCQEDGPFKQEPFAGVSLLEAVQGTFSNRLIGIEGNMLRVDLLQNLSQLAEATDDDELLACDRAVSLYRFWGRVSAGMYDMYSGLSEVSTQGLRTSFTYSSSGQRGVEEFWAPQGRLVEDYGVVILTWPEDVLMKDWEANAINKPIDQDVEEKASGIPGHVWFVFLASTSLFVIAVLMLGHKWALESRRGSDPPELEMAQDRPPSFKHA